MKDYSADIAHAIKEQLEEMDMQLVAFDEDDGVFGFTVSLSEYITVLSYLINVHDNGYTVFAHCPLHDPTAVIGAMAVFCCCCNHGLKNGSFDFNVDEGKLLCKCSVICDDQSPSPNLIQESIFIPSLLFMRYSPAIIDIMFRGKDPKAAVKECECEGPLVQVRILEEAERALRALFEKRRSHGEMDGADNERIEQMCSMMDGMDEDMLLEEIFSHYEEPDTED